MADVFIGPDPLRSDFFRLSGFVVILLTAACSKPPPPGFNCDGCPKLSPLPAGGCPSGPASGVAVTWGDCTCGVTCVDAGFGGGAGGGDSGTGDGGTGELDGGCGLDGGSIDPAPVAVLQGPQGQQSTMSVSLATLAGPPSQLLLSGVSSYDPLSCAGTQAVTDYQFRLISHPTNATGATLEHDGQITSQATATLTLDPGTTGPYRVTLIVHDDAGQGSGSASLLTISVNP